MHLSNRINCAKVKLVSYHKFLRITYKEHFMLLSGVKLSSQKLMLLACIENTKMPRI